MAALIWGKADGGGGLLAFDWGALDYRPAMAAQMPRISNDGKSFTFELRADLKWSDASPITVDDFLFAWDQASREDNRYVQLDLLQEIASYRAPDKQTLEVTLKDAWARDVALAVVNAVSPVPSRVWSGHAWNDAATNPEILHPSVVLGPFTVESYAVADRTVFQPVGTYYVGAPNVPRLELLTNLAPGAAYDALRIGRVNWVHPLPPDLYQEARANPSLKVVEWTAANAAYRTLEFNLRRPFLADKRVRQALAVAASRSDLINAAEHGLAEPQYTFIQPTNQRWVRTGGVDTYDYDLARARQLLRDAGYQLTGARLVGKDGQPIKLQVVYPTSSAPRATIAAALQRQYKQLGIDVDARGLDFAAFTEQVEVRRDFDVALATYGGGSLDPELGPKAQLITNGQQNVTGYSNPQVDELFRAAAQELDQARRKQLYEQSQALVNADVPSHYLYALKSVDAFSNKVQGVATHQGDRLDDNNALLSWSVAR
jgi:peptide/nickel transport system substrate-binding protein